MLFNRHSVSNSDIHSNHVHFGVQVFLKFNFNVALDRMLSFSEEQQQQVQRSSIIYHASMRITRDNGHNTTTTKNSSIDSNRSHSLTIYSCCDKYEKCPCSGWHKNCSHFFTHNRYQNRCKTSQNLPAIISCGDHFIQFISVEVASVDNAIPSLVFCRMPFKVNENIYISNEKVKKNVTKKKQFIL